MASISDDGGYLAVSVDGSVDLQINVAVSVSVAKDTIVIVLKAVDSLVAFSFYFNCR